MTTGNDGYPPPPPGGNPPVPPPPPAGGAPVPPPMPGQPAAQQSKLPLISLIFGLLSLICLGFIAGIVAIITGFMGRSRAKAAGQPSGMATAGIILGFIGSIISIIGLILVISGSVAIFNAVSNQVKISEQLKPAQTAALAYGASTGSFEGLSTEALASYGFTPSSDVTVTAVPLAGGAAYCIEGELANDPGTVIHVPPTSGDTTFNITVNGTEYRYASGGCPAG